MPKREEIEDDSADSESVSSSGKESSTGASDSGALSKGSSSRGDDLNVAQRETNAINCSKVFVALFLLVAAGAAGTVTYFIISDAERSEFKNEVCLELGCNLWFICNKEQPS